MMTFSRRLNEAIQIGGDVVITMLGTEAKDRASIGVSAPVNVRVDRWEIAARIRKLKGQGELTPPEFCTRWFEGPPTVPGYYVVEYSHGQYQAVHYKENAVLFVAPRPDNYNIARHFPFYP